MKRVFHFIIIYSKKQSYMREAKAVLVSLSKSLLVAASYCKYQAHTEKNLGRLSEIKSQGPCKECKEYCLNGGEW